MSYAGLTDGMVWVVQDADGEVMGVFASRVDALDSHGDRLGIVGADWLLSGPWAIRRRRGDHPVPRLAAAAQALVDAIDGISLNDFAGERLDELKDALFADRLKD